MRLVLQIVVTAEPIKCFRGVLQRASGVFEQVGDCTLTLRRDFGVIEDGAGDGHPQGELERQLVRVACDIDLNFDDALRGFDNSVVKRYQNIAVRIDGAGHAVAEQIVFFAVQHHSRNDGRTAHVDKAVVLLDRNLQHFAVFVVNMRDRDQL